MRNLLMLSVCLVPSALVCQTPQTSPNVPPGFVDGSKNPSLIPDTAAYRLVFISLILPPSPDSTALARHSALIAQVGLSAADRAAMENALAAFGESYSAWRASALPASVDNGVAALVQQYQNLIFSTLSGDGVAKVMKFVQNAKTRMVVRP